MARPTLMTHRKFARLTRALGSRITARGVLEIIWDNCYESGDDYLGTAGDIDSLVNMDGDPGKLALALVACGLPEGQGFIEPMQAAQGQEVTYRVHDLWHHAPDYVQKRYKRELERRQKSVPDTGVRHAAPIGGQRPTTLDSQPVVDRTPAPALAPAPARKSVSSASLLDAEPALMTFETVGKGARAWDFTESYRADLAEAYPALDVLAEVRKARAWVNADANRRKTAVGMKRFLIGWMNQAVQRGGNSRPLGLATNQSAAVNTGYSPAALARMKAAGVK